MSRGPGIHDLEIHPGIRDLLRLRSVPGVGDHTLARLVRKFGSASVALDVSDGAFAEVAGWKAARARRTGPDPTGGDVRDIDGEIDRVFQRVEELGLRVVGLGSPGYPTALEDLHDPPPVLFLRGRPEILERPSVAIVGSRKATAYGRRSAEVLGAALARAGIVVTSGLALGVDAAAHRGALQAGGEALGVLGSGVDVPCPRANARLFRELARDHLLVSEFLPGTDAAPHHFPQRNRIMAALSSAVIVVEAAARSGALITVDHALDLGREVLAVPGKVDSATSRGTNAMIRDGATIVCDLEEVVEVLALALPAVFGDRSARGPSEAPGIPRGLSGPAARIWEALGEGDRTADELAESVELASGRVLALLSSLEANGWVEARPGMRYSRR
ncbi:MAG: DNA-processing protein DprA [Longimicrobiales bacterium]|nr:DNA-processing protein DprA [Longimicrobiales bacterium]